MKPAIFLNMEIWKPIVGYEWLYEISNLWKVKSLNYWRTWKEKFLKIRVWKKWYWQISIYFNKLAIQPLVHRLVAIAFIPNPDNLPCVCHKNETLDENWQLYNWVDNLFWWTRSDNMQDMYSKWRSNNHFQRNPPYTNLWKFWKDHPRSRPISQHTKDWDFIKKYVSIKEASIITGIIHQNINSCCAWKYWMKSAGWFIWKYV